MSVLQNEEIEQGECVVAWQERQRHAEDLSVSVQSRDRRDMTKQCTWIGACSEKDANESPRFSFLGISNQTTTTPAPLLQSRATLGDYLTWVDLHLLVAFAGTCRGSERAASRRVRRNIQLHFQPQENREQRTENREPEPPCKMLDQSTTRSVRTTVGSCFQILWEWAWLSI